MDLLNIQPFQETLHAGMCGPACLKMVAGYWGIEKTEKELAELCNTDPELGTSDQDIKRAGESMGLKVEVKNLSSFEDIESYLENGIPVIVDWFTRGRADYDESEVADGHYSVVVGLDAEYIYMQDPEIGGMRKILKDNFLKVWFDFRGAQINSGEDMIIRQMIAIYK